MNLKTVNNMWQVQMEFIPGNSSIWVARLNPDDPIYEYDNAPEAQAKADELAANDPTSRLYRIVQL
jgi:ribosomal protein L16/L10AE